MDDFRLVDGSSKTSPFVIVAPALSPITGQNPTFRIVSFEGHGKVKDFATYFLKDFTDWQLEYDFLKEWHLKDVNAESYAKLFAHIGDSSEAAARWTALYSASHLGNSLFRRPTFVRSTVRRVIFRRLRIRLV